MSAQTIYGWRQHFGTLEPADVKRLRQLVHENQRLKKLVVDRDHERDVLTEIARTDGGRTLELAADRLLRMWRGVGDDSSNLVPPVRA